jgi:hypothetical protein
MDGTTRAKRKPVIKPEVEKTLDSFLWRLANRSNSSVIVFGIMAASFLAGAITGTSLLIWAL